MARIEKSVLQRESAPLYERDEPSMNILDYWNVLRKYRKSIGVIVLSASILAICGSFLVRNTYKSNAVIIPVSSKGGGLMSALGSQLGGMAAMAGLDLGGMSADDSQKIVTILKSRTLAENVIDNLNLMPKLFENKWDERKNIWKEDDIEDRPTMEDAVRELKDMVIIKDDQKTKKITVSAVFRNPELSANVANEYLKELQKFINANALTVEKRNRLFIEKQLRENETDYLNAGKEISDFYKRKMVSSVDAAMDVSIGSINKISPEEINSKDESEGADLFVMTHDKDFATEVGNLFGKKEDIEKKIERARVVKDVPQQVYLTYLMMRRELLAKISAMLTAQYEMAKIEEAKEELAFEVIDYAVPAVRKYKPKRGQICVAVFIVALTLGIFQAFAREYVSDLKSTA